MPGFGFHLKVGIGQDYLTVCQMLADCAEKPPTSLKDWVDTSAVVTSTACSLVCACHVRCFTTLFTWQCGQTMIAAHERGQKPSQEWVKSQWFEKKKKTQIKFKPTSFQGLDSFCLSRSTNTCFKPSSESNVKTCFVTYEDPYTVVHWETTGIRWWKMDCCYFSLCGKNAPNPLFATMKIQ